jgi:hypothetical protein
MKNINTNTDATAETSAQTATAASGPPPPFKPFEVITPGANSESQVKTVMFNIPMSFRVGSDATDERICKIVIERARLNIGQSAKFINYLSEILLMHRYDDALFVQETAAFFMQLADETEGYCEVIEMIEMFEPGSRKDFADQFKE